MRIFSILIILALSPHLGAQSNQNNKHKDKVNAHKIAFITERLSLTEAEAQKFWPLYNSYQAEKETLKSQGIKPMAPDITDREADDQLSRYLDFRNKDVDSQKKFIDRLRNIISSKKILLLLDAERDFKIEILSKMSDKCKPGS